MDNLPSATYKAVQLLARVIQWASAGTVLGISSYFISKSRNQHIIYWVIMVCFGTTKNNLRGTHQLTIPNYSLLY
jgi:hypothetical protein